MAKLIEFEEKEIRRKNFIITLVSLSLLAAIIFACFVYYEKKSEEYNDEEKMAVGIHVKGAVENSGYYEVPYGTRVMDLEDYIGGFCDYADLDSVNLAGYVYDGEEIYVPYKGSADTGAINLNSATESELKTVSGIGEKYAKAILHYRESHEGFHSVIELKEILSEKTYESVCEMFYVE